MRKVFILFTISTVLFLGATSALAGNVGALTTFSSGSPAYAQSVNDNFTAITVAVDDNAAMITTLQNAHSGTRTGYVTVSAAGFMPEGTGYSFDRIGSGVSAIRPLNTSSNGYFAAVSLPHGATITSFSTLCEDNDSVVNRDCYSELRSQCRVPYSNDIEAYSRNSGTSTTTQAEWLPQTYNQGSTVDNTNCLYFMRAYITSAGNIYFYGSRIGYEYTLD